MPRKREDLTKITIRIKPDDLRTLKSFYANAGYNEALRRLIGKHCQDLQTILNERLAKNGHQPGRLELSAGELASE